MKNLVCACALLLMPSLLLAEKPKPNPADYSVTVHVIGSQGGGLATYQHVEALINGQPVELQAMTRGVLALGDYKAKPTKGVMPPSHPTAYDLFNAYEFLFPDGATRYFEVVGLGVAAPACTPTSANP